MSRVILKSVTMSAVLYSLQPKIIRVHRISSMQLFVKQSLEN